MPRDDHIDKPYLPNRKDFHLEKGTVMKSLMKKVFAAAAAIATVFGLAATTVATANAAGDNATLTVSTTDAKFAGKTVNAYKMFSATVSSDGGAVSYTLTDGWKPFFMSSTLDGLTGVTDANVNDKANEYVSKLTGKEKDLSAFAAKASNWAQTNNITADATATVSKNAATDGKYTATFTNLDYGYYVVAVPGATVADTNSQYAALVRVHSTSVDAEIKGALPTVDKKVQVNGTGKDATDAKIGDTLTFTLTSTIPDMSAYNTYTFNFKDTLSKGLTFGQVDSVKVGDTALTTDTDYTVATAPADNGKTLLTVTMKNFKKQQANAGKKITVTYTATLNENAVVGGAGNVNSAKIQYSNNPSTNGTGESEPSKVRVFTYGFTVDKYTGDQYTDAATRLAGAEFTLAHKDGSAISFVQVSAGSATANAVYRVAKAGETGTTTITTPANGKVVFEGLKNGEYTLTETKAPAGYNKLASAIGVKVNGQNNGTDTTNATVTITYNNDNGNDYNQTASNGVIPVQNKSGAILPGTGGMGTIAFTVIGVLVIALGVAWTLKRKNA